MRQSAARLVPIAAAVLLAALLAAPAVSGQEPEAPEAGGRRIVQEIVEVEHADAEALAAVLRVFPSHIQSHPEMGLITVRGNPEDVAAVVAAARRLDVPPRPTRSVEVTAHILGASKTAELSGAVPTGLADVAQQLRQVFGYRGVELVDSVSVRVRDHGDAGVSGALSQGQGGEPSPYRLGFNRAMVVNGQEPLSIRLDGLLFEARLIRWRAATAEGEPGRFVSSEVNLTTDVEVREGQKAVVGKAATDGERDTLILVVEARVIE